jgi:MerR family transcriptional regulator, copper efflux regulator
MPKLGEYLQIKEAAAYLGVCLNTLRNWELTGKIPVHRHPLNNYRLFKIKDLDALIRKVERSVSTPKRKPR